MQGNRSALAFANIENIGGFGAIFTRDGDRCWSGPDRVIPREDAFDQLSQVVESKRFPEEEHILESLNAVAKAARYDDERELRKPRAAAIQQGPAVDLRHGVIADDQIDALEQHHRQGLLAECARDHVPVYLVDVFAGRSLGRL